MSWELACAYGDIIETLPNIVVEGRALQVYSCKVQGESQLLGKFLCQLGLCSQH